VQVAREAAEKLFRKHRRPYTVQQLWENSKKATSKVAMQLAVNDLVTAGTLASKSFGKTLVYWPTTSDDLSTDEFCELLWNQVPQLEARDAKLTRELATTEKHAAALAAEPTNAELDDAVVKLSSSSSPPSAKSTGVSTDEMAARVAVLESREFVKAETFAAAKAEHNRQLKRWKDIKAAALGAIEFLEERQTGDFVDFAHLAGVYDDHEAGVDARAFDFL